MRMEKGKNIKVELNKIFKKPNFFDKKLGQ